MQKPIVLAIVLIFTLATSFAQISGTTFRDYNGNGTRETGSGFIEPILPGVIVNAYNSNDVQVASFTTTVGGTYTIPASGTAFSGVQGSNTGFVAAATAVRLEFIIPSSGSCFINSLYDFSSGSGATYGSAVRFVTSGAAAVNINYAVNDPNDYVSSSAPFTGVMMFVARQIAGNPAGGGTSGTAIAFWKFPYVSEASSAPNGTPAPGATDLATNAQIGSTYGVAYSKQANKVFTSAYLKRHSGLGPANGTYNNAPGAIYVINPTLTSSTGAASYFTSLDALGYPTHNSTGSPAYGSGTSYSISGTGAGAVLSYTTNGLGVIGTNANRSLPANIATVSRDPAAFGQVGRVSLGDLEISDDGQYLFVTNFYDRKLYQLQLNSITNPTSATVVNSWSLPNPPLRNTVTGFSGVTGYNSTNFYDGTKGYQRPFALKYYRGKVYVGAVTTGENGGSSTQDNNSATPEYTDLWAYVYEFNPGTGSFTSAPLLQFPLNFNRGTNGDSQSETWKPWTSTFPTPWSGAFTQYQQPMFSDIEFDADGSMILGFRDRFGDQSAYAEETLNSATVISGQAMGDLYRAYYNASSCVFEMELNAKEGSSSSKAATSGAGNNNGPINYSTNIGGEFYFRDEVYNANTSTSVGTFHLNCTQGGLAMIKGTDSIATTTMDPLRAWSGGISWFSNTNGDNGRDYEIFAGTGTGTFPTAAVGDAGKSNGLGDLELVSDNAPLEIGNRVWNDANGNGIQDAGEAGLANVTVELYSNGADGIAGNADDVLVGTATTDANGNYYFNTSNVSDGDPVTAGSQAGPQPNFNYNLRVGSADWTGGSGTGDLAGYQLTKTDKIGNGAVDFSDNDASMNSSNVPMISITTGVAGQNNHNIDFGFKPQATLGDKVWRDDNKNGIQDSGEPGVAGITVTLYQNGTDGLPGTSDDIIIGTTVTDAYGNYLFNNLASTTANASQYNVRFTLPANYQFTTQTNTQTTGSSNATNLTNTTGGSTAANGSDANTTTGRTGSFWLASGESELSVDAGIVFAQPSTNSIGDKVWYDADGDGIQDTNEAGVAGVTVTLYASDAVTVVATTVTDANGNYIFTGLPASTDYIVGITPPAGMLLTTTTGTTSGNATTNSDFSQTTYKTTTVNSGTAGTQITGVDAGLVTQSNVAASLGDKVWLDLNANNIQDAGEPGVAGVTVNLYRDANNDGVINGTEASTPYAITKTDAFGNYIFNNLPCAAGLVGTFYQVGFVLPSGYTFVTKDVGTDNTKDSDAGTGTGLTQAGTLKQGQRDMSVDAGLVQTSPAGTAKLGDKVWFDADADGVQDAGETGIAGVTVTLYNNVGSAIATTTTDINGNYLFANLAAGDYNVGFSNLPQGYSFSTVWSSNDADATNSDANPATGKTGVITLSAGETELDVDAGLIAGVPSGLASIGNKVWWDVITNNNIQDAGEPGVAGVTVNLYRDANSDGVINGTEASTPYATTVTNALGEYIFTGLAAGTYQVGFTNLPTGCSTVTQNSGADDTVDSDGNAVSGATGSSVSTTGLYTLAAGEKNLTVDLGIINTAKGSFGNKVWIDNGTGGGTANDGIQNGTEPGVAGVMVTLTNAAGQLVDKTGALTTTPVVTTTDVNGNYIFADLTAGVSFAVKFSNLPAGYDFSTKAGTGSADDNKSDADIVNGATSTVTIVANTIANTLDAGITSTRATLGNFVWMDDNGNGVQDAGEAGVAGVTVTLYRPGFGPDGITSTADDALPVASMITDQNGLYLFSNLVAGTYEVEFSTIPGGTIFTQRNTPGDNADNTNSDAVPQTGTTTVARTTGIVLTAGETDFSIDAGIFKPRAVIGNYVWVDSNNDGVQQASEPAASGILVSLIDAGGNTVAVAVTDANGNYQFANVAPGTYSISFTNLPTGTAFTTANAGGNDNTDSDVSGTTITGIVVTTTTVNLSYDAGIVGFITLPVEGLSLNATLQNSKVTLAWNTVSELNTDFFEVERSTNNATFTKTGSKVKAAGTSAFPLSYTSTDDISSLTNNGQVFYRVKLYDLDGRIHYSNVAVVWVKTTGIKVWPNPFAETLQVSFSAAANGNVQLRLTDVTGKTVMIKRQTVATGMNQLSIINLGNINSGNYILEITEEKTNKKTSYKLTKQ